MTFPLSPFPSGAQEWLLDGGLPIDEMKELLHLRELPDEDEFNTLAGYLLARLGHLPATGERIECEGWTFEVVDLDGRRIDKVLVERLPEAEDSD